MYKLGEIMKISPILIAQILQLTKELQQDMDIVSQETLQTRLNYFLVMLDAVAVKAGPEFQQAINGVKTSFGLA